MYFELTNQALSTILLDAIQYYPSYQQAKECFGILLGSEEEEYSIAEYSFPVGNVKRRSVYEVTENREITNMIRNARKIVATATDVASYHSHPYDDVYSDWAMPSNGDCLCVTGQDTKAELIIAIAKVYTEQQPYELEYGYEGAREFIPANEGDLPVSKDMGQKVQFIRGTFGMYQFEVRAYENTRQSLKEIDLYSSEVHLNSILREHKISIDRLPPEAMYSMRKLEYASRKRSARNSDDKIQYHVNKIKRMKMLPLPQENSRVIDNRNYQKKESIRLEDAIRWARNGQLYADLHEDTVVLCKVEFDPNEGVLFLEDLESEIGSTITLKDYMVEAGYVENILLCNVRRFPLQFWLQEGVV